jgi:hypothetical protein
VVAVNLKVLKCWLFEHAFKLAVEIQGPSGPVLFRQCRRCKRKYVTRVNADPLGVTPAGVTLRYDHDEEMQEDLKQLYDLRELPV